MVKVRGYRWDTICVCYDHLRDSVQGLLQPIQAKKEIMQALFIALGNSNLSLTFQKQCRISMFNASKSISTIDLRFPIEFLLQRKCHQFMPFAYEKAQSIWTLYYILFHQLCIKLLYLCTFSLKYSSKGLNLCPSPLPSFTEISIFLFIFPQIKHEPHIQFPLPLTKLFSPLN